MKKKQKVLLFILSLIVVCRVAVAVPAYNKRIPVITITGDTVYITMHGDEKFGYALSEDGYTVVNNDDVWRYATLNDDGYLVASQFYLCKIDGEDNATKAFKQNTGKNIALKAVRSVNVSAKIRKRTSPSPKTKSKLTGERHALVVLMEFQDVRFQKSKESFNCLFNQIGYAQENAKGSVRDYYKYASQGQLDYISDIYGPYTAKNNMNYYGQNSIQGNKDIKAYELCEEAVNNLPSGIDFSVYDNDNDGVIDNLHIVFAGYGEEAGASANAIWSHEFPHRLYTRQIIGYDLAGYSCTPELRGRFGTRMSHIGVVCHELGHALGANDYYDTDSGSGGNYEGTGKWDIMASGSWNDEGASPPNFNPYVRTHDFGWNDIVEVQSSDSIIMPMMKEGNANSTPVIRLSTPNSSDYYLIENRQKNGFDSSLFQSGMLIYHVHPDIEKRSAYNTINNTHPQGMYPVCAKESDALHGKYGDINSAYCPFPGDGRIHEFTPMTKPASKSWSDEPTFHSLYNITKLPNGSILFSTNKGNDYGWEEPQDTVSSDCNVVYSESFENGLPYSYSVRSINGNVAWTISTGITVSPFLPTANASDGKKMATLSLKKGEYMAESEMKTCCIHVMSGHQYTLKLDARKSDLSNSDILKVYLNSGTEEVISRTLNDVSQEWQTIEIPFLPTQNEITVCIYGKTVESSLSIDNIRIIENTPTSVINHGGTTYEMDAVYDLLGVKTSKSKMGIHIINGRKVIGK